MRIHLKPLLAATAICALAWAAPAAAQSTSTEAPASVEALDPVKAPPAVKDVDPALWVVKDADTTIYLFGSIHILKPGLGWFDDGVKTAFDGADQLVLELVEPPAAEAQVLFGKLAMDQQGKSLRSKMNDADRAVYDAAMGKLGIPSAAFDPFEPWAAAITMSLLAAQKSGFDPNSGVERQLTAAAKVSNKPIGGLETMAFQLGVFDSLPEAEQIAFLVETAKMIDDVGSTTDKMVAMWASAETESLGRLMNEGADQPDIVRCPANQKECQLGAVDFRANEKTRRDVHGGGRGPSGWPDKRSGLVARLWSDRNTGGLLSFDV